VPVEHISECIHKPLSIKYLHGVQAEGSYTYLLKSTFGSVRLVLMLWEGQGLPTPMQQALCGLYEELGAVAQQLHQLPTREAGDTR
jgi:hypothetical protein